MPFVTKARTADEEKPEQFPHPRAQMVRVGNTSRDRCIASVTDAASRSKTTMFDLSCAPLV